MSEKITMTQAEIIGNAKDQLERFLEDCTEAAPGSSVRPGDMFARYQQWCWTKKEHAMPIDLFSRLMRERGVRRTKSYGKPYWRGLRLIEEQEANHDQ